MDKAGNIATGPGEACDQADFDRSRDHHEYDWHGARLSLHSRNDGRGVGKHRIWRRGEVRPQCFGISGAPALINVDIAALGPPQLSKHLPQRRETDVRIRTALFASHQHADAPRALALLCVCDERPRHCGADERNELPPFHSITSSARASSMGGMVKPSALAVIRLMVRS